MGDVKHEFDGNLTSESVDVISTLKSKALADALKIADLESQISESVDAILTLKSETSVDKLKIANLLDQIKGSDYIYDSLVETIEELEASNIKLEELALRLEGHQEALVEILFSVAHDLQTPLNGFIGNLDMFAERIRSSIIKQLFLQINNLTVGHVITEDDVNGFKTSMIEITRNLDSIERLQKLVRNLYQQVGSLLEDVSIQKGQINLDVDDDQTQISALVEDLSTANSSAAEKKKIDLNFDYEDIQDFYTDYSHITRIINNLISNAIKNSNTTSRVEVSIKNKVYDDVNYVEVVVLDNGRGISVEDLPHIGETLFRTKSSPKGTGFGLSGVVRLVKLMGGDMKVDSKGKGQGATFTIKVLLDQR